jgi:hypothetical protein
MLRQRIDEIFPERQISFSSYNMFTTASLIGSSDMLCIMPPPVSPAAEMLAAGEHSAQPAQCGIY